MGRPSLLNDPLIAKFCDAVQLSGSIESASVSSLSARPSPFSPLNNGYAQIESIRMPMDGLSLDHEVARLLSVLTRISFRQITWHHRVLCMGPLSALLPSAPAPL